MSESLKKFEAILRHNHHHVTRARQQVFLALQGKNPQSMNDLHTALKGVVDRTSVYRAIELFEAVGIVHRIQIGWKYKVELSDIFVDHHHHISCLGCGRVFSIQEDEEIERLIDQIAAKNNISRPVHQLEIQGFCQDCERTSK